MKVAFVNVNLKDGELKDRELEFYGHKCNIELGTLYLDANTHWMPHDQVRHFNVMKETLMGEDWKHKLIDFDPHIIALSALTYYTHELNQLARWAKEETHAIVIAGGPHVTAVSTEVMEESSIDYAVAGEGEEAFRMFIELQRGADIDPQTIPGFIWREGSEVRQNMRGTVSDLDKLAFPQLTQVNPRDYETFSSIVNFKVRHMPIVTTRGCPYKCVYCHDIMGKNIRYRSPQSVIAEVDYWHNEAGINTFFINDDIFNINRKRLTEIFQEFKTRKNLRFAFPNGLRADLLNKETVDLLIEGGTFYAMVAVESGDERVQSVIKKHLHLDKTFEIIEYMGNQGIILGSFNILGFPTETEEDIRRTIDFNASTTGLSKANFFVLNPHKGTEVYEMAQSEGFMPPTGATQGYFNAHTSSPTKHITSTRLEELRTEAYSKFYLSRDRIRKVLGEPSRNIDNEDRRRFHQIDFSYVLRQFIGINSLTDISDPQLRGDIGELLSNGLLARY